MPKKGAWVDSPNTPFFEVLTLELGTLLCLGTKLSTLYYRT